MAILLSSPIKLPKSNSPAVCRLSKRLSSTPASTPVPILKCRGGLQFLQSCYGEESAMKKKRDAPRQQNHSCALLLFRQS
uniref:Uncharacterized protein n=1 Tax=Ditylenchus dipsaci TaxID=166011 RepID=A0A915CZP2_9BILA